MMAPIGLPCLVGGDCNFQTVQLEFEQAKAQLDGHMQYAHSAAGAGGGKKPEKFPRPEIKRTGPSLRSSGSSTRRLALPSSVSCTPAAVTSSSRASRDPQEAGSSFRLRQTS